MENNHSLCPNNSSRSRCAATQRGRPLHGSRRASQPPTQNPTRNEEIIVPNPKSLLASQEFCVVLCVWKFCSISAVCLHPTPRELLNKHCCTPPARAERTMNTRTLLYVAPAGHGFVETSAVWTVKAWQILPLCTLAHDFVDFANFLLFAIVWCWQ